MRVTFAAADNGSGRRRVPLDDAAAAAGSARTTSTAEPGSDARCSRTRCRSRRCTRLRVTALPTALLTTKPTRGLGRRRLGLAGGRPGWATPARRPDRTARRKDSPSVSRCAAGSTAVRPAGEPGLRRRGSCGPCGGGRTGWRGRRGCACAGGNRAPCAGDGCSAGTYACSRASPSIGGIRDVHTGAIGTCALSAGTAHPRTQRLSVDMRHRSTPGDRPTVRGSRSDRVKLAAPGPDRPQPVDERLAAHAPGACYVRRQPRFPAIIGPVPSHDRPCDPRHIRGKRAPDLRKTSVRLAFTVRLGQGSLHKARSRVHNLWTKLWSRVLV